RFAMHAIDQHRRDTAKYGQQRYPLWTGDPGLAVYLSNCIAEGALQMVDPLCVIETCMRYFYSLAQMGRKANAPLDEVRKCFEKAAHLAALAAPYRAVKLNKDPVDPALRQEASLEELRVKIQKHWKRLAPVLDLEALVAPGDGIANREVQEG